MVQEAKTSRSYPPGFSRHNDGAPESSFVSRLTVRSHGRILFIRVGDIDWVEAEDNYVRFHLGIESHLKRGTMNGFAAKLDPEKFIRIHRSTIINVDRIFELRHCPTGKGIVILRDGTELTLSRTYRENVKKIMNRFA
jgi:two-component system, LytTR family, response regulator